MPPLEKDVVTAPPPSVAGKRFETILSLIDADLNAKREEYLFEAPGFVKRWAEDAIRDKRDMPMVHLIFNLCCLIPVLMTSFFVSNTWLGFGLYLATFATFQARFLLLLHYSSHRPLFKAQYSLLNQFLPMVVCNFFGLPPGVYFLHHCVMHHIENNVFPWDVSSTEPYQRDNFLHFLFYWARFTFAIWFELPYYAWAKKRYDLLQQCVVVSTCYLSALYFLYQWNPTGTWWTFILPYIVTSFALMFGNWSQHIFIDPRMTAYEGTPKAKFVNFRHSYNVMDSPYNRMTFNDGYHVEHHINSHRHWTEMPVNLRATLPDYVAENGILFKTVDFFIIGVLTFTGWYSMLLKYFVDIQEPRRSDEEIITFLKERLKPIRRKADKTN